MKNVIPSWKYTFITMVSCLVIAVNLTAIIISLYLFRYSIYCGLGIGSYSLLIYVPTLFILLFTYFYKGMAIVVKARNFAFMINVIYIVLLFLIGKICFSCVNPCVENLQRGGFLLN
jgi:hypothetical protein